MKTDLVPRQRAELAPPPFSVQLNLSGMSGESRVGISGLQDEVRLIAKRMRLPVPAVLVRESAESELSRQQSVLSPADRLDPFLAGFHLMTRCPRKELEEISTTRNPPAVLAWSETSPEHPTGYLRDGSEAVFFACSAGSHLTGRHAVLPFIRAAAPSGI